MSVTARLLAAPLAALVLLGPLAACSSGPEEQVCAVLEADGDDYVQIQDASLCPPPGTAVSAQGPLWVPVSQLDDDDDHRAVRTTARTAPRTSSSSPKSTTKSTPKSTPRTTTKKAASSGSR